MFLAGDIGGTKTLIALFEEAGDRLRAVREETFHSRDHASLEEILGRFLAGGERPPIQAGCFGVAGAVVDGKSHTTNLPWALDELTLANALRIPRVKLLNDLEAAAYGMLYLEGDELCTLQAGVRRLGNIGVIAAGTGLGEAFLVWDGARHLVVASEGGHVDFAPRGEDQIALLRFLQREFDHVSYERVLSGPGLFNIYRFLRETGAAPQPAWVQARLEREDPPAVISELALNGKDALCQRALDLCTSIYGAAAGNLALKGLCVGGVFIAGGIGPKIQAKLQQGGFMKAFRDKGRFEALLASIPVHLSLNPKAPLLGAAHGARTLLGSGSRSPALA
jgi:glucokinase